MKSIFKVRHGTEAIADDQDGTPAAGNQPEISQAAVQALRLLLQGLQFQNETAVEPDAPAKRVVAGLLRRLEGPLQPFDVIEIATDAVTAIEEDAEAGRGQYRQNEEQSQEADRVAELSKASLRALQTLLGAWPRQSETARVDGSGEGLMAGLASRLDGPLVPFDVLEIAGDALTALEQDAKARHGQQEERQHTAALQAELSNAFLEALRALLAGMALNAGESQEGSQIAIDGLLHRLEGSLTPSDVAAIANEALAAIEPDAGTIRDNHKCDADQGQFAENREALTEALLQALRMVLGNWPHGDGESGSRQVIAGLLHRLGQPLLPCDVLEIASAAVAGLSVPKAGSVTLRQIQRRIEPPSPGQDVRSLKSNPLDCLHSVREASANPQKQPSEAIRGVEGQIQTAKARLSPAPGTEPEAIVQLERKSPDPRAADYAVVFLLHKESSIASRFGEDARHTILRFVNQHLKEALLPADRLVRWKGAAFLASIKRAGSIQDLSDELSSVAVIKVPPSLKVGNGSIRLPISLSWAIFPQARYGSLDLLFDKVDEFIATTQGTKRPE
ncbi:MAG TPA: hypothetical protein VNY05_24780 [Candidatus Acidoferrales bacterium]|nr:hypothetical protein [Candidatus Acidoferrales bacterium]